jgi:hypothetical protein
LSPDEARPGVILANGATFVDNSFEAPGASGCQLNLRLLHVRIHGLFNSQSGLPSPAGTNEMMQNVDTALARTEFVYP